MTPPKPSDGGESAGVGEVSPPFPHCQKESACFAFHLEF